MSECVHARVNIFNKMFNSLSHMFVINDLDNICSNCNPNMFTPKTINFIRTPFCRTKFDLHTKVLRKRVADVRDG